VAHIINLVINNIMTALKINAPKPEELEGLIGKIKKLSKKKGQRLKSDDPDKSKFN